MLCFEYFLVSTLYNKYPNYNPIWSFALASVITDIRTPVNQNIGNNLRSIIWIIAHEDIFKEEVDALL